MNLTELEIPPEIVHKWQEIVNLLAEIAQVPAALIKKIEPPEIVVFVSSESEGNPYKRADRAFLETDLYGETVIKTRQPLLTPDALADEVWRSTPDFKLGMRSYLGFPLTWPTGDIFGTICILDNKPNAYNELHQRLLGQFCHTVETDLKLLFERHQMEAALAQERALLHTVIDNLPIYIFVKDTDSRFIVVNGAAVRNLGVTTMDEVVGKTDFDFHPPELAAQYYADEQAIMQSGEPLLNYEEPIIDRYVAGQIRWLSTSKVPIRDSQGQIVGLVGMNHDITERKQAEEELRQYRNRLEKLVEARTAELTAANEQLQREIVERQQAEAALAEERNLLRTLIENLPDYIYVKDTESRFVLVNTAIVRQLGAATPDEVIGKTDFDFHPLELAQQYRADEQAICQSGQPLINHEEPTIHHLTGQMRWLSTTKVPLCDNQGRIVGLVGLNRDITERKQADERLRESEEKFRSLYTNTPVMMHSIDPEGRLMSVSNLWLESLGYERAEVIGRKSVEFLTPASQKYAQEIVLPDFFRTGMCKNVPYQFIKKNGEIMDVLLSAIAEKDGAGKVVRSLAVLVDVTDRKRAEESLRQEKVEREILISELEAKNAELERFIYTISHDLKSPLITIRGFLGFVERAALAGNIAQMQADIVRIAKATDKMQQLLDELLELSRIGRLMNPPEAALLSDLAAEAIEMVAGRLAERGVEVAIAPDLPPVYGDRSRLRELLENLLDNAVKYMGHQPHPRVEIGVRRNHAEPIFYVRDNGMGIEPRYHQKVFGLFEKLNPQTEGSGVGLAIVKRIVEVHGGRIWIESDGVGQGSAFCFTLPSSASKV
ncbi:MAG: hypothetical protein Fur0044_25280 [Anaerolineae bacterium]